MTMGSKMKITSDPFLDVGGSHISKKQISDQLSLQFRKYRHSISMCLWEYTLENDGWETDLYTGFVMVTHNSVSKDS